VPRTRYLSIYTSPSHDRRDEACGSVPRVPTVPRCRCATALGASEMSLRHVPPPSTSPPQSHPQPFCIPCTNLRAHWHLSNISQGSSAALSLCRSNVPTASMFVALPQRQRPMSSTPQLAPIKSRGFLRVISLEFFWALSPASISLKDCLLEIHIWFWYQFLIKCQLRLSKLLSSLKQPPDATLLLSAVTSKSQKQRRGLETSDNE
jgi:hypothetical protein